MGAVVTQQDEGERLSPLDETNKIIKNRQRPHEYHPALRRGFGPLNAPVRLLELIYCLFVNSFVRLTEWLRGELASELVYLVADTGEQVGLTVVSGAG
jgi:hypothetical protein